MQRKLTEQELSLKNVFQNIASQPMQNCTLDEFERQFHLLMQNPVDGIVKFENINRQLLHNGNLSCLRDYFYEDGQHLFGSEIKRLVISGTCLREYYKTPNDSMPDGVQYIVDLIAKNPDIMAIDLSNTKITDVEAGWLLTALEKNTKLQELNLSGNPISQLVLTTIQENIRKKVSKEEIIKNTRVLAQAARVKNNLFATLPSELLLLIAAKTRDVKCHNEEQATSIAKNNFNV